VGVGTPTPLESEIPLAARLGTEGARPLERLAERAGVVVIPFETRPWAIAAEAWIRHGRGVIRPRSTSGTVSSRPPRASRIACCSARATRRLAATVGRSGPHDPRDPRDRDGGGQPAVIVSGRPGRSGHPRDRDRAGPAAHHQGQAAAGAPPLWLSGSESIRPRRWRRPASTTRPARQVLPVAGSGGTATYACDGSIGSAPSATARASRLRRVASTTGFRHLPEAIVAGPYPTAVNARTSSSRRCA
jgi:hypothetical protein